MNLVVIVVDTLRPDHLGCYGNDWISTPHIDAFARKAVVFDRAYCASFPTVPHRRDLLTGRFSAPYAGWSPLSREETVLADVLRNSGYVSMMVSDCFHILANGYGFDRGFDGLAWIRGQEWDRCGTHPEAPPHPCDPAKIRNADLLQRTHRRNVTGRQYESDTFVAQVVTAAVEWLEINYEKRFLLYVDVFDPHEPWDAPRWYVEMYDPGYTGQVVDYPLYGYAGYMTDAELEHCRALYAAEVTLVDRWVGTLLRKIEDLGLLENTTVIFTSDHGFLFGEHGVVGKSAITVSDDLYWYVPLYEEVNHIPLAIHFPGAPPRRSRAIVQPQDIMPTLVQLAGAKDPGTMDGRSIVDVLTGERDDHRPFAVSAPALRGGACPTSVMKDDWAAILYPRRQMAEELVNRMIAGYEMRYEKEIEDDLLFDVAQDPEQAHDVKDQHPDVCDELRAGLVRYLEEIGADERVVECWR
jgi:arylsulfatase A-like enzyme